MWRMTIFTLFFSLLWLQILNLPALLQNKNTRIGPFPWKRSVLQKPDRERTNQSTGICLRLALPYNNIGYVPVLAGEYFGHVTSLDQSHAGENIWWNFINNYSPKWRWLTMDIYRAATKRGKYWTLATDTEVNSCFSILKQWDNIHHKKLIRMTSSLVTAANCDAIFSWVSRR